MSCPRSNRARFETLLKNFRRRDNIRDFIDGLHDSECWPYTEGEGRPIPATFDFWDAPIVFEVKLRGEKVHELMHLYLIDVQRYHPLVISDPTSLAKADTTDVTIELCPEEGLGAYTVSYEAADHSERFAAPKLDLHDVSVLRSAFIHRHEWVINKFSAVNRGRLEALENDKAKRGDQLTRRLQYNLYCEENEGALSEEEDFDFEDPCNTEGEASDPEDEDEDNAMDQEELDIVVKPHVDLPQTSSTPTSEDEVGTQQGCNPAYGPQAKPNFPSSDVLDGAASSGVRPKVCMLSSPIFLYRD